MIKTYVPKIALTDNEKKLIVATVQTFLPEAEVYIFGSRVLGTAKKYSDVDIAISSTEKISSQTISSIKDELGQNIIYLVDLIDCQNVSEQFQKVLKETAIKIS